MGVAGTARIDPSAGATTIDEVRSKLTITVPEGCDVLVGTTSGRVELTGRFGNVSVVSESGRVEVADARSVDVRTSTGRIEIGRVAGDCLVRTTSGRVEIGQVGPTDVTTTSGGVRASAIDGSARVHTVSGRIELDLVGAGDVDAETVVGRIEITLPFGTRIHRADRLDPAAHRPPDTDCTVATRTVTGRIEVDTR